MALFYKDTAGKMDDVNNDNVGLKTKRYFADASKTVAMIWKPHSDIFLEEIHSQWGRFKAKASAKL